MIVVIQPDGFSIADADDFTSFHIDAGGLSHSRFVELLGRSGEVTVHERSDHAWVHLDFLHDELGTSHDDMRRRKLEEMLAYAASKGWLNESETHVAAHVVNISC
ncbi:hypothetical protein ACW2Q0_04535 [Nocardia sp. R16R-3T]